MLPPLHFFCSHRGAAERKLCAIHHHNSQSYGLAQEDATAVRLPVRDWAEATEAHMLAMHLEKITAICQQELQDDEEEEAAQDDGSIEVHHI
jgi:hypothetical protein